MDIQDGGPAAGRGVLCNRPTPLNWGNADLDHSYSNGWLRMWDGGQQDGACGITTYGTDIAKLPVCPQYTYVNKSDVQPYFDIATNYGFANYMFQSNEGPSFPAHQFLLAGTSAPSAPGVQSPSYLDFVAENASTDPSGCPHPSIRPAFVDPTGTETNPGPPNCYEHQTLADLLDNANPKITWRWYTPTPGFIWTAVNAIHHLCYTPNAPAGSPCNTSDWLNNVIWPPPGIGITSIPFLNDIENCNLQAVSWVMPDQRWSDHPRTDIFGPLGPSYVADLVNEIGQSNCIDQDTGYKYWKDTAIFITWDDWGGFYDHVTPPQVYRSTDPNSCPTTIAPNGWGCGYTYGFRVPLLVVSAYTPDHYVSGNIVTQGGRLPKYEHDVGSILAFIENNFHLGFIDKSGNNLYADFNAIDWTPLRNNIPLSDFFSIAPTTPRLFVPIIPDPRFDKNYFQTYYTTPQNGVNPVPMGPDGDDAD